MMKYLLRRLVVPPYERIKAREYRARRKAQTAAAQPAQ